MESKRGATRTVDDIVCPLVKAKEYIWKRYIRNTRGKHAVASSHVDDQSGWNESCLPAWQEVWSYGTQRYTVQDIIDGNRIPLRSVNGNDVVPNRVKHVWPVGEAEVFTVTDEFGNRVSATANHRILTPDGYKELQHLSIGDKIANNGLPAKDARRANFTESITWSGDGWNYRKAAFEQGWSRCFYCDNEIDEIHHRDRNRDNNEIDNLLGLCSGHHYLIHGKRPTVFGYGVIISIESAGVHPVYDIEMELEDNFVAGGVVVHNSRRYVTENEEFYVPAQFLGAPENKKQGAGDPINDHTNLTFKKQLADHQQEGLELYSQAMDAGIAPEQARLFLPAYGLYIRWRWTVSLNALMHFLDQRLDNHAQFEIRQYAQAIESMVKEKYPMVYTAWVESRR